MSVSAVCSDYTRTKQSFTEQCFAFILLPLFPVQSLPRHAITQVHRQILLVHLFHAEPPWSLFYFEVTHSDLKCPPDHSSCFWQIGSWHWLKKPNLLCCMCLYMAMNTHSDRQGSHHAMLQCQLCPEMCSFPAISQGTPDKKKGITTLVSFSFFSPFISSPLTYLNYSCTCQAAWQLLQWTATLQRQNTAVSSMLWTTRFVITLCCTSLIASAAADSLQQGDPPFLCTHSRLKFTAPEQ